MLLALTFATLDELAPGRIVMGLGAGSPRVLAPQGVEFDRPLTRLREYCEVIPRLIAGEEVTYHGAVVNLEGARIEDVLARDGGGTTHADPAGAGRDRAARVVEYAGEVADGVLLNVCLPLSYATERRDRMMAAARRVGRIKAAEVAMCIVVSPHADGQAGRDGARRFVPYLSLFPNVARETGLNEDFVEHLRAVFTDGGVDAAAPLVGDDVVNLLTAAGTVQDCRGRLDEYRAAGVELPVLAPVDGTLELTINALA